MEDKKNELNSYIDKVNKKMTEFCIKNKIWFFINDGPIKYFSFTTNENIELYPTYCLQKDDSIILLYLVNKELQTEEKKKLTSFLAHANKNYLNAYGLSYNQRFSVIDCNFSHWVPLEEIL